ncbi:hypothetical protein ACTHGU_06170 [Chitinophagaceae bacterium MMS25-I14]
MNISEYKKSGIVEAYVMGVATEQERAAFDTLVAAHPELAEALYEAQVLAERLASRNAVAVPSHVWKSIEYRIGDPAVRTVYDRFARNGGEQVTLVGVSNTQIRVHKYWRAAFIAIFVLSKIFLILAIFYYLSYRQSAKQLEKLEQQVQQIQTGKK